MSDFDVHQFRNAVFNQNVFSVPAFSKEGVKELQNRLKSDQPPSTHGRSWGKIKNNLKDSMESKINRNQASAEIRKILVGNEKGKITNLNVLSHIYNNLNSVSKTSDLMDLKTTLVALKGFGANEALSQVIEEIIDKKLNDNLAHEHDVSIKLAKKARDEERRLRGPKNKKELVTAENAMKVNADKAFNDHLKKTLARNRQSYVSKAELEVIKKTESHPVHLKFSYAKKTDIGIGRETNEDAEFVTPIKVDNQEIGFLLGVLDGHGGSEVSNFANKRFTHIFAEELKKSERNVLVAFDEAFKRVQQEIIKAKLMSGSTAVITFIDTATNKVYTATLGDSEAFICRKIKGKWKLIPLSPIRNWSTDADRTKGLKNKLVDVTSGAYVTTEDAKNHSTKDVRIVSEDNSSITNLSRSLGDLKYSHQGKGVIQKAKVSVFQLEPGDKLFLVCDGITDYLDPSEMLAVMQQSKSPKELALELIANSKVNMKKVNGGDNASVIALNIEAHSPAK